MEGGRRGGEIPEPTELYHENIKEKFPILLTNTEFLRHAD